MITGTQNQSKTVKSDVFSLEDLSALTLESGLPFTLESLGGATVITGQRKTGLYFWGDPTVTWGDSTGVWGAATVSGSNQLRNNLATKSNQSKN